MLQPIFDNIKGRSWDWFGIEAERGFQVMAEEEGVNFFYSPKNKDSILSQTYFSLPDLLANKSWCMAVWGIDETDKECFCGESECNLKGYRWHSMKTFIFLRDEGPRACADYILKTMV